MALDLDLIKKRLRQQLLKKLPVVLKRSLL